ncbi:hypothetical protein OC842_002670 [Tilletia horrida]|uniref:Uncharacterized protein n=1 Tax=Tilletia horrida TaxID=155126 RepID=A0AAN6GEY4_9BASI|nr:hypothetical protein OC842_002670 [Tilletia horrida]
MGQIMSAFLDTKQEIDILRKMCENKLDLWQSELDAAFTAPETVEKKEIPGIRAMRFQRELSVKVTKDSNEQIRGAIDDFFNAGSSGDTKTPVAEGFHKLVSGAMTAILGQSEGGEYEMKRFFVYMQHNAIVRIDVRAWRYNMTTKGFFTSTDNAFAYIACLSVVDTDKVTADELAFLTSEFAGDDEVSDYIQRLIDIFELTQRLKQARTSGGIQGPRTNFDHLNRPKRVASAAPAPQVVRDPPAIAPQPEAAEGQKEGAKTSTAGAATTSPPVAP